LSERALRDLSEWMKNSLAGTQISTDEHSGRAATKTLSLAEPAENTEKNQWEDGLKTWALLNSAWNDLTLRSLRALAVKNLKK